MFFRRPEFNINPKNLLKRFRGWVPRDLESDFLYQETLPWGDRIVGPKESPVMRSIHKYGSYLPHVSEVIRELVKYADPGFFVDVGASEGYFCSLVEHFSRPGDRHKTLAIEPDARFHNAIVDNTERSLMSGHVISNFNTGQFSQTVSSSIYPEQERKIETLNKSKLYSHHPGSSTTMYHKALKFTRGYDVELIRTMDLPSIAYRMKVPQIEMLKVNTNGADLRIFRTEAARQFIWEDRLGSVITPTIQVMDALSKFETYHFYRIEMAPHFPAVYTIAHNWPGSSKIKINKRRKPWFLAVHKKHFPVHFLLGMPVRLTLEGYKILEDSWKK
jgi:FkbM family methyltransferase